MEATTQTEERLLSESQDGEVQDGGAPEETLVDMLNLYEGMTIEVLTLDNKLTFVGKVMRFNGTTITIRDSVGRELPPVLYNKEIKLRCFQGADTLVMHGQVCGSNRQIWKVDRLKNMFVEEKRAFFRQGVNLTVQVVCERLGEDARQCRVLDVSAGGLLLRSREPFEEGDLLSVDGVRVVKEEAPFSFLCRVRGVRPGDWSGRLFGCQFTELASKEEDRLLRAIFTAQRRDIQNKKDFEG